ncbi:MAG: NAD(P)-dependent oxidoreductase [Ignavibacteriales bacterium]|nr:NAD(P)-dependent oxidoreductase [Ignavibacteriales bacterium]
MPVGFVGLGLMGAAMADRLEKAGYRLAIYNRTKSKAQRFITRGAVWCDSPRAVAEQCDVVFTMISTPAVLEIVAKEIRAGLKQGGIHVDCSTVSPDVTRSLEQAYDRAGCHFLHAPVLGSVPQVVEGSLLFFVGGKDEPFRRVEPMLKTIGSTMWRFERVEQATTVKLICNSFIAGMIGVLTQALVFAKQAGIEQRAIVDIIGHSAMRAPMYETKGNQIIARNFTPRFFVEHLLKDVNLFIEAGKSIHAPVVLAEVIQRLFSRAIEMGLAQEDYSAVVKVLEEMTGTQNAKTSSRT